MCICDVLGHKRDCPFKACECKKCDLNAQRRKLMAKANKEKRKLNDTKSNSKSHLRRQRSDDCSSETDRDSGYSINFEDTDQSKLIDPSKQFMQLNKCFNQIQHELMGVMSAQCMAKSILWMLIEMNATSLAEDTKELENVIKDSIIKSSAEYESMFGRSLHRNTSPTMSSMIGPVTPESSAMLRDFYTANNFKSLIDTMHDQNQYHPFLSQFPFLNPVLTQHHLHNKFMYPQIST
ncbi:unnamed protein product [Medioppia subpectinata]|uniref:DM domain-containing protein n=1 Tax=Medioppia subpectinata TaxID=1979941 RepID=A0A7R9LLU5_9ACAR|nr:unnamed protein product [Medioppia subpectinata]CAG2119397.1 unnamed protein product [Medioppia subpectinata]